MKQNNPKKPRIVSADELLKTREKSKKKVEAYIKQHKDQETVIREKLKYCLCDNLFRYKVCDKRPLDGSPGLYHFRIGKACVVGYSIIVCEDMRYKPVVDIEWIIPINRAHKYSTQIKNRKK